MESCKAGSFSKYNNNKHNIEVFYKTWKKYNDIQLTKSEILYSPYNLNAYKALRNEKSYTIHSIQIEGWE